MSAQWPLRGESSQPSLFPIANLQSSELRMLNSGLQNHSILLLQFCWLVWMNQHLTVLFLSLQAAPMIILKTKQNKFGKRQWHGNRKECGEEYICSKCGQLVKCWSYPKVSGIDWNCRIFIHRHFLCVKSYRWRHVHRKQSVLIGQETVLDIWIDLSLTEKSVTFGAFTNTSLSHCNSFESLQNSSGAPIKFGKMTHAFLN